MNTSSAHVHRPDILAPAGNKPAFLAAISAGADIIYCGLPRFSARMTADNFTLKDLYGLTRLAREKNTRVFVALNTLLLDREMEEARKDIHQLAHWVKPSGIIVQDLGAAALVEQSGFTGRLVFSTLANLSFPAALTALRTGFSTATDVVLPRELTIDEIKTMADACPEEIDLEVFIHGALCYGVSGRCYWSSFLGGKSGLRGRCVQPCRRRYAANEKKGRIFSPADLSLDVLVKVLKQIPKVKTWKIEGRKKGPHYVYYTTLAYQRLRDHGNDPKAKKSALDLLQMALGRQTSHYRFLPQRIYNPISPGGLTGSGFLLGRVKGTAKNPFFSPTIPLMPRDLLRIGYEDDPWHTTIGLRRHVPKKGKFHLASFFLNPAKKSPKKPPPKGTPVFLVDRGEPHLSNAISDLEGQIPSSSNGPPHRKNSGPRDRAKADTTRFMGTMSVARLQGPNPSKGLSGLWLTSENVESCPNPAHVWWWLSPGIWPETQEEIERILDRLWKKGARKFVLNAPWQVSLFKNQNFQLWAGPFCNIANTQALSVLKEMGFAGAFSSPELGKDEWLSLPKHSPLPLGVMIFGGWPLSISRFLGPDLASGTPFTSPKGETAYAREYDGMYWIFPNWRLDLTHFSNALKKAGYVLMARLSEPLPKGVPLKKREGIWNWNQGLA